MSVKLTVVPQVVYNPNVNLGGGTLAAEGGIRFAGSKNKKK